MKIKVEKVDRDENKVVQEVVITLDGYMELTFRRINNEIKEVLRSIPDTRLYDSSKLWIPPVTYTKLIKTVYAIFNPKKKCHCAGKCERCTCKGLSPA